VGVPADRAQEAAAELAVVFAALEPAHAAAQRVRDEGRADADARRREAMQEAERIVADARALTPSVRAEAAFLRLAELDEARAKLDVEASAEVERVRRTAELHMPEVVALVVETVWATAGLSPPSAAGGGAGAAA
jgi:hypothetical protein